MEIEFGSGGGSIRPRFAQLTEHSFKAAQRYTLTFIAKISVESGYNAPIMTLMKSDGSYDGSKYGSLNLHDTDNNYETFSYSFAPTEDIDNLGVMIITPTTTAVKQSTVSIRAVKLELGSVSTLAMDVAPNYATELLKCQRYFVRYDSNSNNLCLAGASFSAGGIFNIPLPTTMRTTPTVTLRNIGSFWSNGTQCTPTGSIVVDNLINNNLRVYISINETLANYTPVIVDQLKIDISADL